MELRYCELCGDIIKVQENAEGVHSEQYVCERCAAKQGDVDAKPKERAEDVSLRSAAPTEESNSASPPPEETPPASPQTSRHAK